FRELATVSSVCKYPGIRGVYHVNSCRMRGNRSRTLAFEFEEGLEYGYRKPSHAAVCQVCLVITNGCDQSIQMWRIHTAGLGGQHPCILSRIHNGVQPVGSGLDCGIDTGCRAWFASPVCHDFAVQGMSCSNDRPHLLFSECLGRRAGTQKASCVVEVD